MRRVKTGASKDLGPSHPLNAWSSRVRTAREIDLPNLVALREVLITGGIF